MPALIRSLVLGSLVAISSPVLIAQDTNWSKWGPSDQIGTLNYITPEGIVHAATLAKTGKIYSLSLPVAADQPAKGRGLQHFMLSTGQVSDSRPHWINDVLSLSIHDTTHWDGLGHVYGDGKIYNGYDASTSLTTAGALKNGVHLAANKIVTRGILLDVARHKKVDSLAPGYTITIEDIRGTVKQQGLSARPGDVVLIRTGWLSRFLGPEAEPFWTWDWTEDLVRKEPGIGWEVAQWLKEIEAAAVAFDTMSGEVVPAQTGAAERIGHPGFDWPIHYELIRNQGMMMGALFQLDELANDCQADGIYEFLFVASPYRLTHGTGSPVNPMVLK